MLKRAVSRPQDGGSTYVTGGDVSRFQRRSIPAQTTPPVAAGAAPTANQGPTGPTVRVSRGSATVVEPVAKGAGQLKDRQAQAVGASAGTVAAGISTLR